VGSSQICWGPNRRRSPGWKRSCNLSGSGWGSALWVPDLSRLCEPSLDCPAQLGAQLHRLLSDVCFHLVRSPTFAARCVCPVLGGSRCRRKFYCSLPLDGYLLQPEPSEHHKFVILYSLTGFLASLFYYLAPLSSEVKMEVLMLVPGIGCAGLVVWGLFALYPADSQLTQVIGAEEEHFLPDNATENITPDTGSMKFGSSHPALNIHRDGNPGCMGNLRAQFSAIITLRFAVLFAVLSIAFGTAINFYNNAGSMARTFRMNRDEESVLILVFSGVLLASRFLTGALLALFNPFYYQSRLLAVGVTLFLMFGISVAGKYIFNTHPNVSKILRLMLVFLSEQ